MLECREQAVGALGDLPRALLLLIIGSGRRRRCGVAAELAAAAGGEARPHAMLTPADVGCRAGPAPRRRAIIARSRSASSGARPSRSGSRVPRCGGSRVSTSSGVKRRSRRSRPRKGHSRTSLTSRPRFPRSNDSAHAGPSTTRGVEPALHTGRKSVHDNSSALVRQTQQTGHALAPAAPISLRVGLHRRG